MKKLLCITLFLFTFLFASVSAASATEIIFDIEHHHLGDGFKEDLTPAEPDGLSYTATFTLDSMDIRDAELTLTVKSVVPGPTDEFLDKVYLNGLEIGILNDYIPENTSDSEVVNITIPVHPAFFNPGNNNIRISSGNSTEGSNYDDFEFYDLTLHLSEADPITLNPPLKVAWTYRLPWKYVCEKPIVETLVKDGILLLSGEYEEGLIAVDAETGEPLWDKEWSARLVYKDGVLFAVHSSNIDALDAKTGELFWSKEYSDVWWSTPVIFGDILFFSTPEDRYVTAIYAENGTLKWRYEFNITSFETGGSTYYRMSNPLVNGNILVSRYYASHSIYTEPIAIDPAEPEPEIEEPVVEVGLVALDAKTGKEIWRYPNLGTYSYDPFIYKDLIYIEDEGTILALSAESGKIVWKTNVGEWADIVEVKDGEMLVNSGNSVLLNASNGDILKELPYSQFPVSSSVITEKYVYSTDGYKINIFDSIAGEPVWSSSRIKGTAVSDTTLYKDKLYLVSTEGVLYAFEHGKEGLLFTRGLENSATLYLPPIALAVMLLLLAVLLRKSDNRSLVLGSWLIVLAGVLLLSLKVLDPYTCAWSLLGFLAILVFFFFVPLALLAGIAFLVSGIRKRKR
ncbi:PQQ-binding-like beta-propeller repeat protein [Methanosarcina sp. T3]|uniref:outer membrane protein assembly factor BamB family protein n=1 Tax=Methanosarcina sp. T3 TaxID=3439062 RepID=UPI003F86730C